jgi:hypothetical protein
VALSCSINSVVHRTPETKAQHCSCAVCNSTVLCNSAFLQKSYESTVAAATHLFNIKPHTPPAACQQHQATLASPQRPLHCMPDAVCKAPAILQHQLHAGQYEVGKARPGCICLTNLLEPPAERDDAGVPAAALQEGDDRLKTCRLLLLMLRLLLDARRGSRCTAASRLC